ncbi:MAG: 30S ribosomal protein S24e [Candidatus Hermodarchaeia archaeon]|jgi:small subunit ribosomal protein S24e
MKIKIEEKHENSLLNRQDITFLVDHSGTATPSRIDVRAKLAAMLNSKEDQLYIIKLSGLYGQSTSQGYAHLYPTKEAALKQEQAYIIKRHTIEEAAPTPAKEPTPPAPEEKGEEPTEPPKEEGKPPKKKEEKPKPKEEGKPKAEVKKEEPPKEEGKPPKKKEEPKTAPPNGKPKKAPKKK